MALKGEDRRVRRTKRRLHEAFRALVVEKGYDAMTVQDLLDRADVGRATFYTHFAGKQDLLLKSIEHLGAWLAERQREAAPASGAPGLGFSLAMFEHVGSERRLYRAFIGKEGGALVQRHIQRIIADLVRADLAPRAGGGAVPVDLAAEFAASAFMAVLAWWMDTGSPYTAAEIDGLYRSLVAPGIASVLGGVAEYDASRSTPPVALGGRR